MKVILIAMISLALLPKTAMSAQPTTKPAAPITVFVNNLQIAFTGTPPEQIKGAVLVPLRGVFEALGATVQYDKSVKTISAQKGATTVLLSLGSSTAKINGSSVPLSQPAMMVNGETLVPLRFIAEALGSYVQWTPSTLIVSIQTIDQHLSMLPSPSVNVPNSPDGPQVLGQLTGIYTQTAKEQITVRVNGENSSVPLEPNTVVTLKQNDQPEIAADIKSLEIGDQVRVTLASDDSATKIEAVFGEVVGTLKSIVKQPSGDYTVTLDDGTSLSLESDATVTMAGRPIELGDVMPFEKVKIRTSSNNQIGYSIEVLTEALGRATGSILPASPEILEESPAMGSIATTLRPEIYALIDDPNRSEINPSSVRLFVDGADVTHASLVTSSFVTYQPNESLYAGPHVVTVCAANKLGRALVCSWTFTSPQMPSGIVSFTTDHNADPLVLNSGQQLGLKLIAEAHGSAFVSIGNSNIPLVEQRPGVYNGEIRPNMVGTVQDVPVIAHFTSKSQGEYTADLSQKLTVDAGVPPRPLISIPLTGERVRGELRIEGSAKPGTTVNVRIDYLTRAFGMIPINGTAAQTQVIADVRGRWSTDSLSLLSPALVANPHNTVFTVLAASQDALGRSSVPAVVKVTEQ